MRIRGVSGQVVFTSIYYSWTALALFASSPHFYSLAHVRGASASACTRGDDLSTQIKIKLQSGSWSKLKPCGRDRDCLFLLINTSLLFGHLYVPVQRWMSVCLCVCGVGGAGGPAVFLQWSAGRALCTAHCGSLDCHLQTTASMKAFLAQWFDALFPIGRASGSI